MAFVFHRRLALPLWAMAFFAVALTAPPRTTLFLMVLGIALMAFTMLGSAPWLRSSPSGVQVLSHAGRINRTGPISVGAGACVRTPDEPNTSSGEDALDLVRMDDDGGWQMAPNAGRPVTRHEIAREPERS